MATKQNTLATFEDSAGESWELSIHFGNLFQIAKETGVELLEFKEAAGGPAKSEKLGELIADPEKFLGVVYAIVKKDADERDVASFDAFTSRFDLNSYQRASIAFTAALCAFMMKGQDRERALTTLARQQKLIDAAIADANGNALEALAKGLPAVDA